MIAIHTMLTSNEVKDPVDEGFGADLAYSIKKRLPFGGGSGGSAAQKKLANKYKLMNQRRSEMGYKYG